MSLLQVRVRAVADEALDIRSYELVSIDGSPLPAFTPGAHIDLHLAPGLIRQYSLCNDPRETDRYLIAVKKESNSRGGSRAMHERVQPGDVVDISRPRNNFRLAEGAGHSLLMAGGIGITPLLSMAHHLAAIGSAFDLHCFTRSVAHTAFLGLLSAEPFARRTHFHHGLTPDTLDARLRPLLHARPEGGHLYLCGPKPFMDMVQAVASTIWPTDAVHLEYFTAAPEPLSAANGGFEVRLARSGGRYEIPPDRSIVEVLAEHGIIIETSCEQGVCGTCLTGVLEGTPDHRDVFLTEAEKQACNQLTPCVSRALSPVLVLDL